MPINGNSLAGILMVHFHFADHDVRVPVLRAGIHVFQHRQLEKIIRIQKREILPGCYGQA